MTSPSPDTTGSPIYGAAAETYWDAGWRGVLPLPPRSKKGTPKGYTGRDGAFPSWPDVFSWTEDNPRGNICLRLPPNVIGIDVDNYDGKGGGSNLDTWVERLGALPPTWKTGSRNDGVSGISLYRVPEGLRWPGDLGDGIEIIQTRHRYAIVWPSVHDKTGKTYKWISPEGNQVLGHVPSPEDLPELPASWVDGLTHGEAAQSIQAADLGDQEAVAWLVTNGAGTPCRSVDNVVDKFRQELGAAARSRHEIGKDATHALAHMAAEGHRGVLAAMGTIRSAFIQAFSGDPREGETGGEWNRLLTGAVRIAAMDTVEPADPCDNPLAGLAPPPSPDQLLAGVKPKTPAPAASVPGQDSPADTGMANHPTEGVQDVTDAPSDYVPSWRPVDLSTFLDGTWEPQKPELMVRTDGQALVYPGLVHDVHGESESGKSLVVQCLCADIMKAGKPVIYVDFESDAGSVAARMIHLGVPREVVLNLFTYVRPEVSPYSLAEQEDFVTLLAMRPALVVMDGVTDALVQFGASTKDNDDIVKWHRAVPRKFTRETGAAVILIDHVAKDGDSRGRYALGGQAKMNTLDGASYGAEVTEPIGKGMRGKVTLRIGKDRPGSVRPKCGRWRASDRTQEAAQVVIDSSEDPNVIRYWFNPPTSAVAAADGAVVDEFRPHHLMEKISRFMEGNPEGISRSALYPLLQSAGMKAKRTTFMGAIQTMLDEGFLAGGDGTGRGAQPIVWAANYRAHLDPTSDSYRGDVEPGMEQMDGLIDNGLITDGEA